MNRLRMQSRPAVLSEKIHNKSRQSIYPMLCNNASGPEIGLPGLISAGSIPKPIVAHPAAAVPGAGRQRLAIRGPDRPTGKINGTQGRPEGRF